MSVRYKQVATEVWNINNSYDVGTVVEYDGNAYVSVKVVPVGVNIGFTDYWKKITVENDIESLQNNVDALQSDVEDLADDIGTLSELSTTNKSNLVGAINEVDGSIIVEKVNFHDVSFTNNTTIDLTCSKEGYTLIGVVGWQIPSVDRTKVTGLIELYIDATNNKICANPHCTESVTGGHISVWALFAKA